MPESQVRSPIITSPDSPKMSFIGFIRHLRSNFYFYLFFLVTFVGPMVFEMPEDMWPTRERVLSRDQTAPAVALEVLALQKQFTILENKFVFFRAGVLILAMSLILPGASFRAKVE